MHKLNLFFRLTKIDEATRTVTGIATAEQPDKAGEICDYEGTKPYYKAWSESFSKATDGASLGNLRSMHTSIAAGKLTEVIFDDVAKAIRIVAKVVDDAEWKKVVERVYTGFSQGGEYIRKWIDGEFTRYIAEPFEVSLVDNPCLASATFDFVKMDGTVEKLALKTVETEVEQGWKANDGSFHKSKALAVKHNVQVEADAIAEAAAAPAKDALVKAGKALDASAPMYWDMQTEETGADGKVTKRDFSDDKRKQMASEGTAMSDGSFPIESPKDVENAVSDWGRTGSKDSVKQHIIARATAIGATDRLPAGWVEAPAKDKKKTKKIDALADLHKFACGEVFDASAALDALQQLVFILWNEKQEVVMLDSEEQHQVAQLEAAIASIKAFVMSELGETDDDATKALKAAELKKAADDNMDHVNAIHKAAGGIMKACMKCMNKADGDDDGSFKKIHKAAGDIADRAMKLGSNNQDDNDQSGGDSEADDDNDGVTKLAKSQALNTSLTKALGEVNGLVADLSKRLEHLEKQPAPRKGSLFAVDRSHEVHKSGDEPVEAANPLINIEALRLSPEELRRVAFGK